MSVATSNWILFPLSRPLIQQPKQLFGILLPYLDKTNAMTNPSRSRAPPEFRRHRFVLGARLTGLSWRQHGHRPFSRSRAADTSSILALYPLLSNTTIPPGKQSGVSMQCFCHALALRWSFGQKGSAQRASEHRGGMGEHTVLSDMVCFQANGMP